MFRNQAHFRRRAQSLLELVAAVTVSSIALVPALRMMRDSLEVSRGLERVNLLATCATDRLERSLAACASNWTAASESGDFASLGHPDIRFETTRTDQAAAGGMPGRLMVITSRVWQDSDGNGSLSAGEKNVVFATKLASVLSYQYEATY